MHESADELAGLQDLLDRSYASAGAHLLAVHTPSRRLDAAQVAERLQGICLLVLATVGSGGSPFTAAVDGVFFRGAFVFGTDPRSLRWRQLLRNPNVSATHLPSERWAVSIHGRAAPVDTGPSDPYGIRAALLEVYAPVYGANWYEFLDSGPVYARIEAVRMFAFDVSAGPSQFTETVADR